MGKSYLINEVLKLKSGVDGTLVKEEEAKTTAKNYTKYKTIWKRN